MLSNFAQRLARKSTISITNLQLSSQRNKIKPTLGQRTPVQSCGSSKWGKNKVSKVKKVIAPTAQSSPYNRNRPWEEYYCPYPKSCIAEKSNRFCFCYYNLYNTNLYTISPAL